MMGFENCYEKSNKVVLLYDDICTELNVSEKAREELIHVNNYIEYSVEDYGDKVKAYIIYFIEDRYIDEKDNLILLCKNKRYIKL